MAFRKNKICKHVLLDCKYFTVMVEVFLKSHYNLTLYIYCLLPCSLNLRMDLVLVRFEERFAHKLVQIVIELQIRIQFVSFWLGFSICLFKDPEPYLLLGLGNSIQRMKLDGGDQRRIMSRVGRSILLDFHLSEGAMFWADTQAGHISRAGLDGTRRQVLLKPHYCCLFYFLLFLICM